MDWKDYEIYIHKHFQRLFPDTSITHNVKKIGIISKTKRQVDIYIDGKLAGFDITIIVDCKYFNKKVDVKDVESFLSFLHDLKASKGILITNIGYTQAAFNRATNDTQDIELRIIDFKDLDKFQAFCAIGYAGPYCAYLPAPPGWVIDGKAPGDMIAAIYPAGLTFDEAMQKEGFMYVKFSNKGSGSIFPTLKSLTDEQDKNVRKAYPSAKIEYFDKEMKEGAKTLLRIADIHANYGGLEYTVFIDFGEFIVFIVLLARHGKDKEHFDKLKWVIDKLKPGKVIFGANSKFLSVDTSLFEK